MSIEQNRAIAIEFLTAIGQGRGREVVRLFTADATWWINGTTKLSGTYRIDQVLEIARSLFATTEGPMDVTFGAVTAEEDRVSVESRARVRFADGRQYDNRVHFLLTITCGKISSVKEYLDTDHLGRISATDGWDDVSNNKAIARRLYEEVVGGKNLALLEELIAPDAIDYNAQAQGWSSGREGFRRHLAFFHSVFADLKVVVDDLVAEGERIVVFWTLSGNQTGELWGVPPTGKRVTGSTISILKIRNGKVAEYESRPDRLGLLLQLGGFGSYVDQLAAARG